MSVISDLYRSLILLKDGSSVSSVLVSRLMINICDHSILNRSDDVQKTVAEVGPFVTTVVDRDCSYMTGSFSTSDSESYEA